MPKVVYALKANVPMSFFRLRVLAWRDNAYGVFVAQCLETGSVVTADDIDTLKDMVKEILDDEVAFAVEHLNLPNLFSTPAPIDVWVRYLDESKNRAAELLPNEVEWLDVTEATA